MANNQPQSGPDETKQPARGEARSTASGGQPPPGGPLAPNAPGGGPTPPPPANRVDAHAPQQFPDLGQGRGNVKSDAIDEAERIKTGPGSSAQANSGAAFIDDLFGKINVDADEDDEGEDDEGPKVVVLHTYVSGPGGGPYIRGKVITIRDLLGPRLLQPKLRRDAKRHLQRYLEGQGSGPAIRPATREESKVDFITFPEGEQALSTALDDANARADAAQAEMERLREELRLIREGNANERASGTKLAGGPENKVDTDALLDDALNSGQRSAPGEGERTGAGRQAPDKDDF